LAIRKKQRAKSEEPKSLKVVRRGGSAGKSSDISSMGDEIDGSD
jgi:hypothetical protein